VAILPEHRLLEASSATRRLAEVLTGFCSKSDPRKRARKGPR
jgi:hypothetical protein